MKLQSLSQSVFRWMKQRPKAFAGISLAVVAIGFWSFHSSKPPMQSFSSYEAKHGEFLVSVIEGGTLEAVNEVSVRSEVEGVARIIYIVPEGSYVKRGDLLVELDSSSSQDTVNLQQINVEKAQFALVQSEQQLEIQKSVVESEIQGATLRVEFAQSDLEKFTKGEALQAQRNAEIEITNVLENLQIAQERLDWSEKLYKEGFETKGNLDKDRLTVSETKLKREQTEKALWMVNTFDNPKKKRALESAVQEATENLERVKLQGERKLAQFSADVESQKKTLELSQTKLDRDKAQLLATKIYAPQDGLVVYGGAGGGHFSSESMIEEGAVVRNRQEIIKLPDVSEMKLQVKIHESHINQIRMGQPAYVVLDSIPDQRFHGAVSRVAPLPDTQSRWGNPDLKLYATEIVVTDKLPEIKPGVSARAEIIVTNLSDALSIPLQAVTTRKGKPVVFLADAPQEPIPVEVGMYNTKFIQITSGVKAGDRVLLAPPFDAKEKDLGGAIIADGENPSAEMTNKTAQMLARVNVGNGHSQSGNRAHQLATAVRPEQQAGANAEQKFQSPNAADLRGGGTNRQELLRRFDADHDGKLSDAELTAMRLWLSRHRGTNAPHAGLAN